MNRRRTNPICTIRGSVENCLRPKPLPVSPVRVENSAPEQQTRKSCCKTLDDSVKMGTAVQNLFSPGGLPNTHYG